MNTRTNIEKLKLSGLRFLNVETSVKRVRLDHPQTIFKNTHPSFLMNGTIKNKITLFFVFLTIKPLLLKTLNLHHIIIIIMYNAIS